MLYMNSTSSKISTPYKEFVKVDLDAIRREVKTIPSLNFNARQVSALALGIILFGGGVTLCLLRVGGVNGMIMNGTTFATLGLVSFAVAKSLKPQKPELSEFDLWEPRNSFSVELLADLFAEFNKVETEAPLELTVETPNDLDEAPSKPTVETPINLDDIPSAAKVEEADEAPLDLSPIKSDHSDSEQISEPATPSPLKKEPPPPSPAKTCENLASPVATRPTGPRTPFSPVRWINQGNTPGPKREDVLKSPKFPATPLRPATIIDDPETNEFRDLLEKYRTDDLVPHELKDWEKSKVLELIKFLAQPVKYNIVWSTYKNPLFKIFFILIRKRTDWKDIEESCSNLSTKIENIWMFVLRMEAIINQMEKAVKQKQFTIAQSPMKMVGVPKGPHLHIKPKGGRRFLDTGCES